MDLVRRSGEDVLASSVTYALLQTKYLAQDFRPIWRWVIETPEPWGGGFEAKANFDSAALLVA
jgi:hypothetical protein